jgi:hypothetical protein
MSDHVWPQRELLNEITMRLTEGKATEGWSCEPYGAPYDDAWGAAQWVTVQAPGGEKQTLLVTVAKH